MGEDAARLRVTEIFHSLQGEGLATGERTAFVRLTGCPLRCRYCDSAYAFTGGTRLTIPAVLERVAAHQVRHVCVTGGEPLAQPACLDLLKALCDAGHQVSLETAGALDLGGVDPRVVKVMDLKAPGSGEVHRNRFENLALLTPQDQIKFVLCDEGDYRWAVAQLRTHGLERICTVLFSAAAGELAPNELAEWILRDRLPVRLQLQLHKILWGEEPGR
ncbi:organic radical activating enzyme [Thioflavicoccus mobilis 8321]|uniref:7-carboxy-7-deazaguanine synthase n=1 Tax=Thioflavicoccus mobilis 8321 TaxID=765912 RepID=L0GVN0_9GAMM|nr:7-carboxy-7-deazaguanine synthase QueE [Thioflavicoccus mobilis]AGA89425.1 organic radical activating enzyme [Thioflavicoccus mobilis 8321]